MAKYYVAYCGMISESNGGKTVTTPQAAVTEWFKGQKKYPTEVGIKCLSAESEELTKWCKDNQDKIRAIMNKTGVDKIFKVDKFLEIVEKKMHSNPKSSDKCGVDEVYPFCQG